MSTLQFGDHPYIRPITCQIRTAVVGRTVTIEKIVFGRSTRRKVSLNKANRQIAWTWTRPPALFKALHDFKVGRRRPFRSLALLAWDLLGRPGATKQVSYL